MDVRTCRKCKMLFNYLTGPIICPSCREKLEEKFQEVKKYIEENKGATIRQVAEECDVETQQIQQWLREDRLELADNSGIQLTCEGCGASIRSGKYCEKCRAKMTNGFQQILNGNKPKEEPLRKRTDGDKAKMRFLQ